MSELMTTLATTGRLVARDEIQHSDLDQMHRLLDLHFDGVTFEQFRNDLEEKNYAILIEREGRLLGFSTILAYETTFEGEPLSVVYSGDTIMSPAGWNTQVLPRSWIEAVASLRARFPRGRYFWLLITSGFRSYRFLPLFWREFYPRYDSATPEWSKRLLDCLAVERFGASYDRQSGIIHLPQPQRLRAGLAGIPPGRQRDPHIRFFASQNPGHADGDELVCITELTPQNLTSAGRRMTSAILQW